MINAMKDYPKYRAMMKKYHKHMSLATECMQQFERKQLKKMGEFEQDMATGLTSEGDKVVAKTLKTQLVQWCQATDVGNVEKLRLLMIYLISQGGIQESTRKELMRTIHPKLQRAVLSLSKLGVDLSQAFLGGKSKHDPARLEEFAKRNKDIPLALMRYIPVLHSVINDLLKYELSEKEYPYTSPPPEKQSAKAKDKPKSARAKRWRGDKEKTREEKEDTRPRFIVFIVGGVTFSETRSTYEIATQEHKGANLMIGSCNTLVPGEFVRALAGLNERDFKAYASGGGEASTDKAGDDDD